MTLTEILIKGVIRIVLGYTLNVVGATYMNSKYGNDLAKLSYGYSKKKKNYAKTIIGNALYFIPVVGTILVVINVLIIGGLIVACQVLGKDEKGNKKIIGKFGDTIEMPDERLKKLQRGQEMHKAIIDSLKVDGLDDKEIKEFMKEAKKEEPYLNSDNSKEINISTQRTENLKLLEDLKEELKNPKKAYKYSFGKKIQFADIDDEFITIGVSKLNRNGIVNDKTNGDKPKIYTKKFELKQD